MIKPFKVADLGYFLPNKYSNPDMVLMQLTDPAFEVQTQWDNDSVASIICFKNYWGNNWMTFILVSENFQPKMALELREHIRQTMIKRDADRLQTQSAADEKIDKWHEFLGFFPEGYHKKMIFNQDYRSWAIMRRGA